MFDSHSAQFFALLCTLLIAPAARADWPFTHPHDDFHATALLDLRGMNETVAGQSGFIHLSPDGQFLRGDNAPIRFWACGSAEYDQNPQQLADHARFLAKLGVNMVRIHAQISSDSDSSAITDTNDKEIEAIWQAVAAFKHQGIYVTISPYWATDRAATQWGIDGYARHGDLWGLLFFNPTLQNGYKAWVRKLYTQNNPYTGIPLANDPAVAIIEIQNEDGLFFWTVDAMKPQQKHALGRKFAIWLAAKYGSLDDARDAWKDSTVPGDQFASGDVTILPVSLWTRPQRGGLARRLDDQLQFFAETQRQFFLDITRFYRNDLNCKQLINASNWITADPVRLNDVERYTDTADDVLAVNKYFTGVHDGKNAGWRIDPGDGFTNHPAVLNPWDLPTNLKQVAGHPMMITESTWVSPMDFQNEGPFLAAAYQSLTGVAGCYWFTATSDQFEDDPRLTFLDVNGQHPFRKWTCSTPNLMANFPAAAILYRNAYIQRGQPVVQENRPLADLWDRKMPLIAEDPTFDPNRNSGQPADGLQFSQCVHPLAYLVGPVTVTYGGDPAKNFIADLSSFIDDKQKTVTSNTGQIRMNYSVGLCTIDAPCAQGASGFLNAAGKIDLTSVHITSHNRQASVLVVSMDGLPLSESAKILIQVGTPSHLTGYKQTPADFVGKDSELNHGFKITTIGAPPWRIENADLKIRICNAHLTKMTALDPSGYPTKQIPLPATTAGGEFQFPKNAMYAILQ